MEESTNREKVLKKLRAALLSKTVNPFPRIDHDSSVYSTGDQDPLLVFAEELEAAGGHFILCNDELECVEGIIKLAEQYKWKNFYCGEQDLSAMLANCAFSHSTSPADLPRAEAVISSCECLVARTGTVVFSSRQNTRLTQALSHVQLVIANANQLAFDIKDAIQWLKQKYIKLPSMITMSTGPSRVSYLGGETVIGAHGTRQLFVFLVDEGG